MLDRSMTMSFPHTLNFTPVLVSDSNKNRTQYRARSNPHVAMKLSSVLVQTYENRNLPESKKISGSASAPTGCQTPISLHSRANTIGIIGGSSVFSTLIFLEKLAWWSSKGGEECLPFLVCSDPVLSRYLPYQNSRSSFGSKNAPIQLNHSLMVDNLQRKRAFLEQSGASCIVMPCHLSHAWYGEISEGCSLPFLHVGECVARELKEAKLKPLEAGSSVRIGVLCSDATLIAGFYQEKLQNQGFEVVLPDKATMEHIVIPAMEALNRKDMEGARNLLRIALRVLLVRAVNRIILASDEMQGILPRGEPLLKKCINPMDSLARSTIKWAHSIENTHKKS
ncbi:uncharacterized protein LOC131157224 [Malania oleifera]|uniref:uncharacterized protein LOC131157224 n=1 Tax=Malania oleifera TaxID=397392 RepID=UPI0025ADD525|nr:uncharacterized protein LOC131157224 [Malania oleifera]